MDHTKPYTIIILAENKPGVLYRIADLFLRRKINIESLTVSETLENGVSQFTIVVKGTQNLIEKIIKQLYRIIEVSKVLKLTEDAILYTEICLLKVSVKNLQQRQEVSNLVQLAKSEIIHVGKDNFIIQKCGTEEEINKFIEMLRSFGLKGVVRSGRIALVKE